MNGDPLMKLAELPLPQSTWLARWPPQVRMTGVVTAGMDRMNFLFPIHVGELVTFSATVNAAWRTSMEVGVRVESEDVRTRDIAHTSTAYLTMVALGEHGNPAPVPPLVATTPTEQRRLREAELRRTNRLAERAEIQGSEAGPRTTRRLQLPSISGWPSRGVAT